MIALPAVFTFPRGILPQWAKDAGLRLPSPMRHADASATPLTPEQIRAEFKAYGVSISDWCRQHGFSRMSVVDLLRGHGMGLRGDSHRAAVALGMKPDPRTKQIHHPFKQLRRAA